MERHIHEVTSFAADLHRFIVQVDSDSGANVASLAVELERIPTRRALDGVRDSGGQSGAPTDLHARVHRRADDCESRIDGIDMMVDRAVLDVRVAGPWLACRSLWARA